MKIRKTSPPLHCQIDGRFEDGPLSRTIEHPLATIFELPAVIKEHVAEQEFKATLADERVSLDIEKDVS
jgi:hypothetical protein